MLRLVVFLAALLVLLSEAILVERCVSAAEVDIPPVDHRTSPINTPRTEATETQLPPQRLTPPPADRPAEVPSVKKQDSRVPSNVPLSTVSSVDLSKTTDAAVQQQNSSMTSTEENDSFKQSLVDLAAAGNVRAQNQLGLFELKNRNYKASYQWFEKAAQKGNPDAQCNLGLLYINGLGVEKNRDEGLRLLRMAAQRGYGPALEHVKRLETQASSSPAIPSSTSTTSDTNQISKDRERKRERDDDDDDDDEDDDD